MDALTLLSDKQEIVELVLRYSTALDTRDWTMLESCFAEDAAFDADGFAPIHGAAAIRDTASSALAGLDASQHFVTNITVALDSETATVTSYLQAQHVRASAGDDPNFLVAGIYRDNVTRTPNGWRFSHRRLQVLWTTGNPDVPTGAVATKTR
jgi:hypothetical protein